MGRNSCWVAYNMNNNRNGSHGAKSLTVLKSNVLIFNTAIMHPFVLPGWEPFAIVKMNPLYANDPKTLLILHTLHTVKRS